MKSLLGAGLIVESINILSWIYPNPRVDLQESTCGFAGYIMRAKEKAKYENKQKQHVEYETEL